MSRCRRLHACPSAVLIVAALVIVAPSRGQDRAASGDRTPAIASISPPGATLGKVVEWTVTGRNLDAVQKWMISGAGVEIVEAVPSTEAQAVLKVKVEATADPGFRELRATGPGGLSNLAVVRVDALDQAAEVEPNDAPEQASPLTLGSAAWGVLKPQDIDHFRIEGKAGSRITIDLEAQRLGTPVVGVVTIFTRAGLALAQARETRGVDHDARLAVTLPADGPYLIQVRDHLYAGGDSAAYRLRVKEEPFASGLFPLGGPPGATIAVTASGENLSPPRSKTITLPNTPGALVDPGPFYGPGGAVLSPMRLLVGGENYGPNAQGPAGAVLWPMDGLNAAPAEVREVAPDAKGQSATPLPFGATANGRIDRPGEVDRYVVPVKKGEILFARIRASDMGSWLDSVLTLRDASGAVLAENDDPGDATPQRNPFVVNQTQAPADSRLSYQATADGDLTIEVADRFNEGGHAHGYRLEVGPTRPDFAISLLFNDPNANRRNVAQAGQARSTRSASPGALGALNLKPGASIPINFLVTAEGKTGPIEVKAEGLPPGVTGTSQTIRVATAVGRNPNARAAVPSGGNIVLKVDADAPASLGEIRFVATARPENGPPIVRAASAAVTIDTPLAGNTFSRPITRTLTSLPIQILGDVNAPVRPAPAASPVAANFASVTVPGVLLQGGRIDLMVETDPPNLLARGGLLEVAVSGAGLASQPVVMEGDSAGAAVPTVARIVAGVDAEPGVREVTLKLTRPGSPPISKTVSLIVRAPIALRAVRETIAVAPGMPADLCVSVSREAGYEGAVEINADLPDGVAATGRMMIPAGETLGVFPLKISRELARDAEVRVTGIARTPRGPVRVEAASRPVLVKASPGK